MANKDPIRRKQYHREYHRRWYEENKEGRRKQILAYKKETKALIRAAKSSGCSVCGYNKCPQALEFHHQDDNKEFEIGVLINNSCRRKLSKEISKCVIVCANCHREIHFLSK